MPQGHCNPTETVKPVSHLPWRNIGLHSSECRTPCPLDVKIYRFQDQFKLIAAKTKSMTSISLFTSLIYGQYRNKEPLAKRAPLNGLL